MASKKTMSDLEIANNIKAGKVFFVNTESERKKALSAARFLDARVKTTAIDGGGFEVLVFQQ